MSLVQEKPSGPQRKTPTSTSKKYVRRRERLNCEHVENAPPVSRNDAGENRAGCLMIHDRRTGPRDIMMSVLLSCKNRMPSNNASENPMLSESWWSQDDEAERPLERPIVLCLSFSTEGASFMVLLPTDKSGPSGLPVSMP